MAKTKNPFLGTPTTIDILYLFGFVVSFVSFNFISAPILYLLYPIFVWSLYQDWRSARVAEQRPHWYFVISDLFTIWNYVSLFVALTLSPNPQLGYSDRLWFHWGVVFFVYIIWNLIMRKMPDTDEDTKSFFLHHALIETPIFVCFLLIFFEIKTRIFFQTINFDIFSYSSHLVIIMGLIHLGVLLYWIHQTYISSSKKRNSRELFPE